LIFLCFDNPFYNRDKSKWLLTLESINCYDLIVFQQSTRVKYAKKNNLNYKVIPPLFNKNIHKPLNPNLSNKKFRRDVIFLGTWFPERGKFAKRLIKLGLKFEIHGPQWNKDPEYKILSNYVVSKNGLYGIKYTKLISESKIVISLPNFHNDDDITMKSLEITAIGSLLLTNNTKSHRELFENKKDAFFFKNADECVKICKFLLKNIQLIKKVSKNGYKKITRNSKFNFEKSLINSINAIM
jgi:spore maturation protein CgeB